MASTAPTAIAAFPAIATTAAWLRPSPVASASAAVPTHAAVLALSASPAIAAPTRDDAGFTHVDAGVVRQNPDAGSAWTAALAGLAAATASTAGTARSAALCRSCAAEHGSAARAASTAAAVAMLPRLAILASAAF
ncbi:hypothetical protein WME73_34280 [Sorangium sp. So ce302]|uniref:hypothetical protein n=1 Tax=unclassified Sorangium TaxID=2621164 RepID=UPI003F6049C4